MRLQHIGHVLPLLTGFGGLCARICSLVRMGESGRREMLAPCQGAGENGRATGGVASLNHRLMARNPPGSPGPGKVPCVRAPQTYVSPEESFEFRVNHIPSGVTVRAEDSCYPGWIQAGDVPLGLLVLAEAMRETFSP